MMNQLESRKTRDVERILESFGYATRETEGRFALIAVGRDRIILLYGSVANGRDALKQINSSLDEIFFDRKIGTHTYEMYVVLICDENTPDGERYVIEADTNVCRKLTIPMKKSQQEQIAASLATLKPLDVTGLMPPASTRVEDVFADVLKQSTPQEIAGMLSQAFREHWPSEKILYAVKGNPS